MSKSNFTYINVRLSCCVGLCRVFSKIYSLCMPTLRIMLKFLKELKPDPSHVSCLNLISLIFTYWVVSCLFILIQNLWPLSAHNFELVLGHVAPCCAVLISCQASTRPNLIPSFPILAA